MTPGAPGKDRPRSSKGQSAVRRTVPSSATPCSAISYQIEGIWMPRCMSLASSGLPLAVRLPDTTQLFEPTPEPVPAS